MESDTEEEKLFVENITFTDFDDLKSINFEETISFVRECMNSQQIENPTKLHGSQLRALSQHSQLFQNSRSESLSENWKNIRNLTSQRSIISTQQTNLCNWGLPTEIVNKYSSKGVKNMFKWQVECLGNSKVINDNGNLVYSAPTSAGKTLVAEILTIKTVLERQKKVIIILPFVSVVREKMFYFQDIFNESGIRVEGYMGSHSPPGGFQAVHIAICTIEKANSLINNMLESGLISDLGAVVVDELHLLGDPHRGYILELLLTKLLYVSRRYDEINIQIIGMSATLPNLSLLSQWLNAELYKTDFRPIPLTEQYHIGGCLYNSSNQLVRTLEKTDEIPNDKDNIIFLSLETITQGCSVLIFCPSKNWCENLAHQISLSFRAIGYSKSSYSTHLREQLDGSALGEVLEQLKTSPVGLDAVLHQTISFGVAFHHAGLTMDEKDIIEGAFKRNVIRVLVSTSTLSSGVNLPARRVIIRSPTFCSRPINILTYKQMIGRAGRMGMDTAGESVLMCTVNDKSIAECLVTGTLEPVSSCLKGGDKLLRAVLEAIASQVAKTPEDIELFINCTLLLNSLSNEDSMKTFADETVKELIDYELIRLQTTEEGMNYIATALGKACLSSSMSPQDGLVLFKELQKARECFVLETDLHMIYLVTPYSICSQWGDINWMHLLSLWDGLCKAMKRVGEMVGIQESLIYRCARGSVKADSQTFQNKLKILKRFYTSLALQDLINEVPLSVVAANYNCSRGMLQSLQQSAATFAGMVTAFSRQLGWKSFESLVSQFQDRLQFGIQSDLLDLMRLQSLNGVRARALFNSGIESVNQLAVADPCHVENALHTSLPFQSEKERDGEMKYDVQQRNALKNIWITGMKGVTAKEAADLLIQEARTYLQHELGVIEMNWQTKSSNNFNSNHLSQTDSSRICSQSHISADASLISPATVSSIDMNNDILVDAMGNLSSACVTDSPVILSDSDRNLNIYDMTTQLPVVSVNESGPHSKISDQDDNIFEIGDQGANELLQSPFCKSVDSSKSEEFKLELTPTGFETLEERESPKMNSVKEENNVADENDSNADYSNRNSLCQSDASKELSIFEDSLEIDTQLCKLLDKSKVRSSCELRNSLPKAESSPLTSEVPTTNITSIDKIFAVPFEESLKPAISPHDECRKSFDDVILSSQENNTTSIPSTGKVVTPKRKINSSHKSEDLSKVKKRRFLDSENIFSGVNNCDFVVPTPIKSTSVLKSNNSRRIRKQPIKYSVNSEPSFLTKGRYKKIYVPAIKTQNTPFKIQNTYLYFVDMTNSSDLFSDHCSDIEKSKTVALFLDCDIEKQSSKIGHNIIKSSHNVVEPVYESGAKTYRGKFIKSVAIFVERNVVYYFDLKNSFKKVVDFLNNLLGCVNKTVIMYEFKYNFLVLNKCFDICINSHWEDPVIAEWLLDPEAYYKPIHKMFETYFSVDLKSLLKDKQPNEVTSLNAWATYHIMIQVRRAMRKKHIGLLDTFCKEMNALKIVAECEMHGMEVDKRKSAAVLNQVKDLLGVLEKQAFKLAGQRFRFSSPSDVAKVLGMYNGRKVSTNKKNLEKIDNPLAQIVIYWRKLSTILSKNLFPLSAKTTENAKETRIYGTYWTLTSTGRMSMQEPNLQSIPRNFEIPSELFHLPKDDMKNMERYFSCRNIFPSAPGTILISADYCQLELRILAHLCVDPTLRSIVSSGQDIFRAVASTWKCIPEDEVEDDLRQQAKQMCYGIIYGMGCKSLAQTLDVCELEAGVFINTFHSTYPGIQEYVDKTAEACRKLGYVETLNGRRRYLPHINSASFSEKAHAERQAVNTTIQGSAADILKSAMISLHGKLSSTCIFKSIKLVLLLHDELMYEVPENLTKSFIEILKESMEGTVSLSVPLPVKIKTGKRWGEMKEME